MTIFKPSIIILRFEAAGFQNVCIDILRHGLLHLVSNDTSGKCTENGYANILVDLLKDRYFDLRKNSKKDKRTRREREKLRKIHS